MPSFSRNSCLEQLAYVQVNSSVDGDNSEVCAFLGLLSLATPHGLKVTAVNTLGPPAKQRKIIEESLVLG